MSKITFRVLLSDDTSAVVAALSEFNARAIVTEALLSDPLDRGLEIARIEASDDPCRGAK